MTSIDFRGGSLNLDVVAGADHALTFNFTGFTVTGDTLTVEVFNPAGTSMQTYTLTNTDADTAVLSMADIALAVGRYDYSLRSAVADAPLCAGEFRVHAISTPRTGSASSTTIAVGSAVASLTVELGAAASLSIGTVTTVGVGGSATASITGTAPSQVLNLGLPTGATGAQGPTGPTGATGATGPQGIQGVQGDWSAAQTIRTVVGTTDTPTTADAGRLVTFTSSSAVTVTITAALALSAGQRIDFAQLGSGQVTFVASGVTLNATPTLKTRARYSAASLVCLSSNVYLLTGDMAAV